jgi:hypothetical protein
MLSLFLKLENVHVIQTADGAQVRRKWTDDHSTGCKKGVRLRTLLTLTLTFTLTASCNDDVTNCLT